MAAETGSKGKKDKRSHEPGHFRRAIKENLLPTTLSALVLFTITGGYVYDAQASIPRVTASVDCTGLDNYQGLPATPDQQTQQAILLNLAGTRLLESQGIVTVGIAESALQAKELQGDKLTQLLFGVYTTDQGDMITVTAIQGGHGRIQDPEKPNNFIPFADPSGMIILFRPANGAGEVTLTALRQPGSNEITTSLRTLDFTGELCPNPPLKDLTKMLQHAHFDRTATLNHAIDIDASAIRVKIPVKFSPVTNDTRNQFAGTLNQTLPREYGIQWVIPYQPFPSTK